MGRLLLAGQPVLGVGQRVRIATLYNVNPATNATTKQGLTVTIPGDGSVTGQVFNASSGTSFNGDQFLFVSEDGTISGWRGALGTMAETLVPGSASNVYKGAAFATVGTHSYLYAANFRAGTIDVQKGDPAAPGLTGGFADPTVPAGFAPFNIQKIGNSLFVTYALQDAAKHDDVAGLGNGFVDEFDLNGNLIRRVATQGTLNSPWGVTLAPAAFDALGGDLLIGNFGDGRINVFDPTTASFLGQLDGADGSPLMIDGLWALTPGNGGRARQPAIDLFFLRPRWRDARGVRRDRGGPGAGLDRAARPWLGRDRGRPAKTGKTAGLRSTAGMIGH